MTVHSFDIEKAHITVTPPGGAGVRFALPGSASNAKLPSHEKRTKDRIHYDMYRRHPIVRAAVDKKAKVASSNGFAVRPFPTDSVLDELKASELRAFLRRSKWAVLARQTMQDLNVYGRAYWWLEYRDGRPYRAKRLHPEYVDPRHDGIEVVGFRYGPEGPEGREYDAFEVLPILVPDPDNDIQGLSPLESLEMTVAVDLFAMDYNGSYFENNAQTGIIFSIKGASETELERNRAWLEEHYVGTKNAHRPLLLEGEVEVSKSVASQQEMGFIEGRKMNSEEILAVLDVAPDQIGIQEDSNRSTAKESAIRFKTQAVRPDQMLVESAINDDLILERFGWDDVVFAFNEIDHQEEMDNLELIVKAQGSGLLNTDEGRNRLGYGKLDKGGDVHFVQTSAGLVPLELLLDIAQVGLDASRVSLRQQERLARAPLPSPVVGGQPGLNPNRPGSNRDDSRSREDEDQG